MPIPLNTPNETQLHKVCLNASVPHISSVDNAPRISFYRLSTFRVCDTSSSFTTHHMSRHEVTNSIRTIWEYLCSMSSYVVRCIAEKVIVVVVVCLYQLAVCIFSCLFEYRRISSVLTWQYLIYKWFQMIIENSNN